MKSELLKLDAPYNVIYAGGVVGRHIATLVTWREDKDGEMDVNPESYPVLDMGGEFPAGKLVPTDVEDCRVLCPPEGTNLLKVADIIKYDFQQEEPAGVDYIMYRMKQLKCPIALFEEKDADGSKVDVKDYRVWFEVYRFNGLGDESDPIYRVRNSYLDGFYFESQGTEEEIYLDLKFQMSVYRNFYDDQISIHFESRDGTLAEVMNRLNADQEY